MLPVVPVPLWWLLVGLAFLMAARSLEGLLCQMRDYLRPQITDVLQKLKTAIVDRWEKRPADRSSTAASQGTEARELRDNSGGDPRENVVTPGLGILLDVIMFCAALPGSAIILYVGLSLVLPDSFFPVDQPEGIPDHSVTGLLYKGLRSPAGITAVFIALVEGLAGAHLFESVETREAYHFHSLWQRPPLVFMLLLLSLGEGILSGARTYYYLYSVSVQNPPASLEDLRVVTILKITAVVTLGVLGVVIPWALALGAAALRNVLDMIGQALRRLWHWVVEVARATWSGICRWVGVVIELAVLIAGWLLVWVFRFLAEGLIGLIRVGAALWRGPTVIVGAALIASKEWLQKFLGRK